MSLRIFSAGALAFALICTTSAANAKARWVQAQPKEAVSCLFFCPTQASKPTITHVTSARRIYRARVPVRHASAPRQRYRTHASRDRGSARPAPIVEQAPVGGTRYLIAFRGMYGLIDEASVRRIAASRGEEPRIFDYWQTKAAVDFMKAHRGAQHEMLGFSAGAQASVLGVYVRGLETSGLPLPLRALTVGLCCRAGAFYDPRIPTTHYIDSSGQPHAGQRDVVNLGARTPHLGPGGGMARVAALLETVPRASVAALAPPARPEPKPLALLSDLFSPLRAFLSAFTPAPERTALYDISAHTVYLPDGRQLEAHAGLARYRDDATAVYRRWQGPPPPNTYELAWRKGLFYGQRAIRLNPTDQAKMHGRDGILGHRCLVHGCQSHGCLAFPDYATFQKAFAGGEVTRLVVVAKWERAP